MFNTLFTFATLACSALAASPENGFLQLATKAYPDIPNSRNWSSFEFLGEGQPSKIYKFVATFPTTYKVDIVDSFCVGDQFDVYRVDDDQGTNPQLLFETTEPVPYDNCATYTTAPETVFDQGTWSSGTTTVDLVEDEILYLSIVPQLSPATGGSGNLRVYTWGKK